MVERKLTTATEITTGTEARTIKVERIKSTVQKIGVVVVGAGVLVSSLKLSGENLRKYQESKPPVSQEHAQGTIPEMIAPAIDSVHKTLRIGESFEVGGKTVVIGNLWMAANTAYPDDPNMAAAAEKMLEGELPAGMSPDNVRDGLPLTLRDDAAFGHEYNPE